MKRYFFITVTACLAVAAVVSIWFTTLNQPSDSYMNAEYFTIHSAESLRSIATRLEQEGIIRSALLIEIWSRLQNTTTSFRRGEYHIYPGLSMIEVHNLLLTGKEAMVRITIPEGYTIKQIAERLEEYSIVNKQEFLAVLSDGSLLEEYGIQAETLQGFLYPDTYFFPRNFPARKVVRHMLEVFFNRLATVYPEYRSFSPGRLYDTVILASIVEREYVAEEEAPIIASVFYNRLNAGMKLQSCATVVYVITEEELLEHPSRLLYSDLERKSLYNTYIHTGLPPAPISNPGMTALYAAFYPAETDYWYFVLKGSNAKQHHFSRSYEEHDQAAFFYLKLSS